MQLTHATPRRPLGQAGFTLTEVLVSSALGLMAMTAVMQFNRYQLLTLSSQANQIDLQTSARSVVDLFAREVRRAGFNPGCDIASFSGIADARTTSIRIQADFNDNGTVSGATESNEDITYSYNPSNNTLQRIDNNTSANSGTLLTSVDMTGSTLRYFDGAGNELVPPSGGSLSAANRSAIRRVRLELALTSTAPSPLGGQHLIAQAATNVDLRNRFFTVSTTCPGS